MIILPLILLASTAFATGETIARINHVADFPVYHANNRIGYIPAPNQSGSFRGRGEWAFNERSMGTAKPFEPSPTEDDVLLLGDSIVFGRVTMTERQRLGGRIAALSRKRVWPISAGSWGLQNEMQYLQDNADVLRGIDRLVLILNSNDFDKPSSWRSEAHRPTRKPWSALLYWLEDKQRRRLPPPPREMLVTPRDPIMELKAVLASTNIPIDIWLHPKVAELANPAPLDEWHDALVSALGERARIFRVEDIGGWSADAYADAIHPNRSGDRLLSRAISRSLRE